VLLTCVVRSTFQPHLPVSFRLASPATLPALPSDRSSACASVPIFWPCPSTSFRLSSATRCSSSAVQSPSDLRLRLIFPPHLRTGFPTCVFPPFFRLCLPLSVGLRLCSAFQPCLPTHYRLTARSPSSLSRTGIWRPFGAAGFPTPFSTASGVSGLVAGPSKVLRPVDFE